MTSTLHISTSQNGVTCITFNRPETRHAFNQQLITELTNAIRAFEQDDAAKILLLTSSGATYSSGADFNWMRAATQMSADANIQDARLLAELLQTLYHCHKPTLTRIQGPAYGGALGVIACCDIAVASTRAQFCFSETRIGLIPAVISPYIISAIGEHAARRYFLTAETFSAETAEAIGLIHATTTPETLDTHCDAMLEKMLSNAPAALSAAKQLIRKVAADPLATETIDMTVKTIAEIRRSAEAREGMAAFLEKRKPAWQK